MNLGGDCQQHACLFLWSRTSLAGVFLGEMSIVVASELEQPSPAPWLRLVPTERLMEQHNSPGWSSWPHIIMAYLSGLFTLSVLADVLTSPAPELASCPHALCNIFYSSPGQERCCKKKTGHVQVPARHLCLWEKIQLCPWAKHTSCETIDGRGDVEMARGCTEIFRILHLNINFHSLFWHLHSRMCCFNYIKQCQSCTKDVNCMSSSVD